MFDLKKIEDYKIAIDDKFILSKEIYKDYTYLKIEMEKTFDNSYILRIYDNETLFKRIEETLWETFRKKVSDYFSKGVNL